MWPKLANGKARILIVLILPLQGAIKAKISKFTVSKIQPIRLKDLGHVTRIDQSETSILRFRRFLRSTGETQNIRPVIGQFWSRDMSKKKKGDGFNFKIISPFSFPLILFSFSYSSSLFSLILHFPFLSFHCIHLPLLSWFHFHCTCYVPCDDHQSAYFLYLSINTYLLFSWLRPVHWPLSLLVYLHIDTYLSFLSQQVMSCSFSHANQGRLTDYHLCQPGSFFDRLCFVVSGIWASEHSHHRSAHLPSSMPLSIHSLTLKCPLYELSQRSLAL